MSKTANPIFLFFLFFYYGSCYCQNAAVDSLKQELKNPKIHDTTRIAIMSEIIGNSKNGDAAISYYNPMIKKLIDQGLQKKGISKKERDSYKYNLAYWYCDKSAEIFSNQNAKLCLAYYEKAIALFKELKLWDEVWLTVNSKGYALRKLNLYDEAIECFFSALKQHEKTKNQFGIASSSSGIATVYDDSRQFAKSLFYNKKAMRYYDGLKNPVAQELKEKQIIAGNIGNNLYNLGQYEEAKVYINKVIKINREIGNIEGLSYNLRNLGDVLNKQRQYEQAVEVYKQGLALAKTDKAQSHLLSALGKTYYRLKNMPEAKNYLLQAMAKAEPKHEAVILARIYLSLFELYNFENDEKAADAMLEKYRTVNDPTYFQSTRDALLKQQLKYDFEKKELNYKLSTQKANAAKNSLLIVLSATLLLIVLGVYFYYRNNKQKQAISILERDKIKQKLLISQMNPHFIFNSIQNIRSLIYNKQEVQAVDYLNKFSKLTRQILENSNENYTSLAEEIELIKNYIAIQQLLYNNAFDFNIYVDEAIDPEAIFLPPMLTQPYIENAIKHGLSDKPGHGKLEIRFYLKDGKLFFEVIDNGNGFAEAKSAGDHKSIAMTITKQRLVHYTKNKHFEVYAANVTDPSEKIIGAKVSFEIPYIYEN